MAGAPPGDGCSTRISRPAGLRSEGSADRIQERGLRHVLGDDDQHASKRDLLDVYVPAVGPERIGIRVINVIGFASCLVVFWLIS